MTKSKKEIKLRIWQKLVVIENELYFSIFNILDKNDLCILINEFEDWFNFDQYSGMKDKNYYEIYEGDIVNIYTSNWLVKFGQYDNGLSYEDEISGNGFYIERDLGNDYGFCVLDLSSRNIREEEIEIIGNIYQNTELLTQKNI